MGGWLAFMLLQSFDKESFIKSLCIFFLGARTGWHHNCFLYFNQMFFFSIRSQISRQSIDACKDYFRDDLLKADWALMVELKKQFQIL